jgi:hypothetical protein
LYWDKKYLAMKNNISLDSLLNTKSNYAELRIWRFSKGGIFQSPEPSVKGLFYFYNLITDLICTLVSMAIKIRKGIKKLVKLIN